MSKPIERVMDPPERAVPFPAQDVAMQRAARRQVLRDRTPLAAGAENIEQTIDYLAQVHRPRRAATLRRRDHLGDQRPLGIGHVTGIARPAPVIPRPVLRRRLSQRLRESLQPSDSQMTRRIQDVRGQTLRPTTRLHECESNPDKAAPNRASILS